MARGPGKGNTNNPKGKPKGTKSAKTKQWEALGDFLTDEGANRAMKVLENLSDKDFLDQYGKLLNYFKPKMQNTQLNTDFGTTKADLKAIFPTDRDLEAMDDPKLIENA